MGRVVKITAETNVLVGHWYATILVRPTAPAQQRSGWGGLPWASGALAGAERTANQRSSGSDPNHPTDLLALKNGCQAGTTHAYSHQVPCNQPEIGAENIGGDDLSLQLVPVSRLAFNQAQEALTGVFNAAFIGLADRLDPAVTKAPQAFSSCVSA